MKEIKRNIAIVIVILMTMSGNAQQFQPGSDYLFNPYSLTPAMAGITGYSEVFADYKTSMSDIDGHPRTINVNGYGNISKGKMWLGGNVTNDKTGILSVMKIDLSYTYKLQVENNQFLYFGIWTSLYQGTVNLSDATGIDTGDPLLQNNADKISSSSFNVGFGINYNWDKMNIGFSMPSTFSRNHDYTGQVDYKYMVQREFRLYAYYIFELSEQFKLQTMGVVYKAADMPGSFDLSAMGIIHDRFWGALMYRSGGAMDIVVGAHISQGFVFSYSYEAGLSNIYKGSGGSHELTLGFRFGFKDNDSYFGDSNTGNSRKKRKKKSSYSGYPGVNGYNY